MAQPEGVRRTGRARKGVHSYAEEPAEQTTCATNQESDGAMDNVITIKSDSPEAQKHVPPVENTRKRKKASNSDPATWTLEQGQDNAEFSPPPKKKSEKSTEASKAPGKIDFEGIMRLDSAMKRPPGEKRPPQMWEVPKRAKAGKGAKSINLAAILAESFEERWQKKVSKIPRLKPGEEETRLKAYVPSTTESYETFLQRASTQRMFVLSRTQGAEENCHAHHDDCPAHEVKLAGTTGNVYTIIISHMPTCSCPNTSFKRNNSGEALCKHILYVLHYVLKAPAHLCYQNAFLTSELKQITANAPVLPATAAAKASEEPNDGIRKPVEDECPICCMEFKPKSEDITWCRAACGNNIHQQCFDLWAQTKPKDQVTCPYCRSRWLDDKPAKAGEQSATLMDFEMPMQRTGGYFNVRDQLAYD